MSLPFRQQDYEVIGWRAWFSDFREFDSVRHSWRELPPLGALVFRYYYRGGGGRMAQGADVYWRRETEHGVIYAHDSSASARLDVVQADGIKFGSWVTDAEYIWAAQSARDAHYTPHAEIEGRAP